MTDTKKLIEKWNKMSHDERIKVGDVWINNQWDMKAWDKDFDSLSAYKQYRVITSLTERK